MYPWVMGADVIRDCIENQLHSARMQGVRKFL